jgi:hypothetical protein
MASRVKEKKASLYGYQKKKKMVANIAQQKHVAPELFYVFGPEGSCTLLEVIQKKHLYTKAADAYSVGVLVSLIWKEEWDITLLPDATVFHGFELKLRGLQDKDA